jgi:hypothetical protein
MPRAAPTSTTSRRALPAVALPGVAPAAEPDPVGAWGREWAGCLASYDDVDSIDDCDFDEVMWHRIIELESLIRDTPAKTLAGLRAKLAVAELHARGRGMDPSAAASLRDALETADGILATTA